MVIFLVEADELRRGCAACLRVVVVKLTAFLRSNVQFSNDFFCVAVKRAFATGKDIAPIHTVAGIAPIIGMKMVGIEKESITEIL